MWTNIKASISIIISTAILIRATSDRFDDLQNAVNTSEITSKTLTEEISTVFIKNRTCNVYVYDPNVSGENTPATGEYQESTVSKLYTCISCEMATWTLNTLYRFLNHFPQTINADLSDVQNNVFCLHYKILVTILKQILEMVKRFINILLNFISIDNNNSYYDTDLIRSLLTLNFKISVIKNFGDAQCSSNSNKENLEEEKYFNDIFSENSDNIDILDDYSYNDDGNNKNVVDVFDVNIDDDDNEYSSDKNNIHNDLNQEDKIDRFDDIIVRMILKSINSILSYMTLNCDFPLFSYNDDQSSSHLSLKANDNYYKITDFLNHIHGLRLESLKSCSTNEMLLLHNNDFNWDEVKWNIKERNIPAAKVVERIKVAYDLELIHLYVQLVFKTIMKIILSKTLAYNSKIPNDIIKLYKYFYEEFISDSYNLPSMIVEIFTMLNDLNGIKHKNLLDKINSFMELVSEISIGSENQMSNLSLKNLLRFLLNNVDKVRCFIRIYEFLRGEYRKYYVPFLKDSKKIENFLNNITIVPNDDITHIGHENKLSAGLIDLFNDERPAYGDGCKYIEGLNYYCFMIILSLNGQLTMHQGIRANYYYKVKYFLEKINDSLKTLVSDKYYDRAIFETVYRTIPLLQIHSKKELITSEIYHTLRLVYAVVFELYAYILLHCRIPEFSYWHPHNMNLSVVGRSLSVDYEIAQAWTSMKVFGRNVQHFQYLKLLTFEFTPSLAVVYEVHILFNWKSEKKDLRYIQQSVKTALLSPSNIYVCYDILIKYFVAIVFYELKFLYNLLVYNDLTRGSWCTYFSDLLNKIFHESRIPFDYKYILLDINKFFILIVGKVSRNNNGEQSTTEEFEIIINRIINQFTRIGVSFVTLNFTTRPDKKEVKIYIDDMPIHINYFVELLVRILDSSLFLNIPKYTLRLVF